MCGHDEASPIRNSLTRIAQLSALAVIGAVVVALLLTRDSAAPLSSQSSPPRIEKLLLGQSVPSLTLLSY